MQIYRIKRSDSFVLEQTKLTPNDVPDAKAAIAKTFGFETDNLKPEFDLSVLHQRSIEALKRRLKCSCSSV